MTHISYNKETHDDNKKQTRKKAFLDNGFSAHYFIAGM